MPTDLGRPADLNTHGARRKRLRAADHPGVGDEDVQLELVEPRVADAPDLPSTRSASADLGCVPHIGRPAVENGARS